MMRKLMSPFIPAFIKSWRSKFLRKRYLNLLKENPPEKIFEYIYKTNYWGATESVSGAGSTLEQTAKIREALPAIFKKYKVRSFLDLPCGDFYWMSRVDFNGIQYIGGDIVKELIAANQAKYGNKDRNFRVLNLLTEELPGVDMMLCRDCFIHLSDNDVHNGLENIKKSKIKYLLTTSYVDRIANVDILTGEFRTLNLTASPYNFVPIEVINEKCTEKEGTLFDKSLILIDLDDYRNKTL